MSNQQLMLIIVGSIIIGIAVAVGINMFEANEVESNRSALIQDLQTLASQARQFYMKPIYLHGGSRDFRNATMQNISGVAENDNGRYYIDFGLTSQNQIVFVGVGTTIGDDDDTVSASVKIDLQSITTNILH